MEVCGNVGCQNPLTQQGCSARTVTVHLCTAPLLPGSTQERQEYTADQHLYSELYPYVLLGANDLTGEDSHLGMPRRKTSGHYEYSLT